MKCFLKNFGMKEIFYNEKVGDFRKLRKVCSNILFYLCIFVNDSINFFFDMILKNNKSEGEIFFY